MGKGTNPEKVVREIHRRTRRRFSAEEKIRIILVRMRFTAAWRGALRIDNFGTYALEAVGSGP